MNRQPPRFTRTDTLLPTTTLFRSKNVRRPLVEPAERQKFLDALFAQPFDVERAAADEMAQPLEFLRRANEAAGAAHIDLALFGDRLAAAHRAMIGKDIGIALFVAGEVFADHRDHVARALDDDAGARPHAERPEERRVGNEGVRTDRYRW